MKTSNKLIVTAFVITLVCLLAHDYKLKAVYMSESYLNPLRNFIPLNFKGFNAIDVNCSKLGNVKIVQGPFRVMVNKYATKYIHVSQKGEHLQIDVIYSANDKLFDIYDPDDYNYNPVYISCPSITNLNIDNKYIYDNKPVKDSIGDKWRNFENILHGFKLDSIQISEDNGSHLVLDSNDIGILKADVGISKGSAPIIEILNSNKIREADFDIENKSDLQLSCIIPILNYHLDDSSRIILTGAVSNRLTKK